MTRILEAAWGTPRRAAGTTSLLVIALLVGTSAVPVLRDFAAWLVIGSPLAVLAARFPNETKQLLGRLYGHLAWASKRLELEAVRQDLEGTLSLGASRVAESCPPSSMAAFRIDYIRSGAEVDRLPDGTLVVGVARHENRVRNLVTAAWAIVRHGIIPDARPFLDQDVSTSLDFVLTKSILTPAGTEVVADFLKRIWSPAALGNSRLRALTDHLQQLEDNELLGPIVLSEFLDLAARMGTRFPNDDVAAETARFVDYLYELAMKEPGEDVGNLVNFDGNLIRCKLIFVARPEVYAVKGPGPYRKAVGWALDRAYHSVYLLAAGRNRQYLDEIAAQLVNDPRIRDTIEFKGRIRSYNGRIVERVVLKIVVDVRYVVGIGQRPLVAVGPGRPAELDATRSGRRSRTS